VNKNSKRQLNTKLKLALIKISICISNYIIHITNTVYSGWIP